MNSVGQRERMTQKRVIQLFTEHLGYHYLGNWHKREDNRNIEPGLVSAWLTKRGVSEVLIARAIRQLDRAAS
ncbi:HsdR family type I site-specific deoxyribonuclease [Klebsiella pneumoniae]|nr:HsdR family type I site-specific deoxyribonuclease [Klebsiella pneumoniae]